MRVPPHPTPADPGSQPGPAVERLESWKEIAAYLNRTVRTVHRWEKEEGLPVHRLQHKKRGSVYAFRGEIDSWWETRRSQLEIDSAQSHVARSPRRHLMVLGLAFTAMAAFVAWTSLTRSAIPGERLPDRKLMLAVLPFENLNGDDQDYLSDGLTDELITELGRLQPAELGVIARTSIRAYKQTRKSAREIGHELGVDYLLEGTVRRERDLLRINAQLVDVRTQTPIWADRYDGELREVLAVQGEVARDVASAIRLRLAPARRAERRDRRVEPAAYEAYLKGRHFWSRRSQDGLRSAVAYLQQAIEADPGFALAYADLADVHGMSAYYGLASPRQAASEARTYATKALALDDDLAEAHTVLANLDEHEWDWSKSERGFLRAIDLDPNYARAYHLYGLFLERQGRVEEAKGIMQRALKLDPVSLIINKNAADPFYFSGEYDRAIEQYQRTLELDSDFVPARLFLGFCYEQKGLLPEAVEQFQRGASLDDDPKLLAALGHAYARSRNHHEARKVLTQLMSESERHVDPYHIAVIHAGLDEYEEAFTWLASAFREKSPWLLYLRVDPRLQSLRSDRRYADLLLRMTPST
jgi:TolB-like protein/Tfp pilus assembly protein PilF